MQQLHSLVDIQQLLFSQLAASLGLFQSCSQFLQFGLHQVVASLNDGNVLLQIIIASKRIIKLELGVLNGKSYLVECTVKSS